MVDMARIEEETKNPTLKLNIMKSRSLFDSKMVRVSVVLNLSKCLPFAHIFQNFYTLFEKNLN